MVVAVLIVKPVHVAHGSGKEVAEARCPRRQVTEEDSSEACVAETYVKFRCVGFVAISEYNVIFVGL